MGFGLVLVVVAGIALTNGAVGDRVGNGGNESVDRACAEVSSVLASYADSSDRRYISTGSRDVSPAASAATGRALSLLATRNLLENDHYDSLSNEAKLAYSIGASLGSEHEGLARAVQNSVWRTADKHLSELTSDAARLSKLSAARES